MDRAFLREVGEVILEESRFNMSCVAYETRRTTRPSYVAAQMLRDSPGTRGCIVGWTIACCGPSERISVLTDIYRQRFSRKEEVEKMKEFATKRLGLTIPQAERLYYTEANLNRMFPFARSIWKEAYDCGFLTLPHSIKNTFIHPSFISAQVAGDILIRIAEGELIL